MLCLYITFISIHDNMLQNICRLTFMKTYRQLIPELDNKPTLRKKVIYVHFVK